MSGSNYNETNRVVQREVAGEIAIFEAANLGDITSSYYTLEKGASYSIKATRNLISGDIVPIIVANGLQIQQGGLFTMNARDLIGPDIALLGSFSGDFFHMTTSAGIDQVRLDSFTVVLNSSGAPDFFKLNGNHSDSSTIGQSVLIIKDVVAFGAQIFDMGALKGFHILNLDDNVYQNFEKSLTIENVVSLRVSGTGFLPASSNTAPSLVLEGDIIGARIIGNTFRTNSSEAAIRIDPAIPDNARIVVQDSILDGDGDILFDTDGDTGTFTAVTDASFSGEDITSVGSSTVQRPGGPLAAFFHAGTQAFFVNQIVTLSTFTNPDYNVTGRIEVVTSSTEFEVHDVLYGGSDSGEVESDTVTLTDTGTSVSNGDTMVINTTNASAYDGGTYAYNALTDSFQINRPYSIDRAGTWSQEGLDHKDPRVLAFGNPGFLNSRFIGSAVVRGNENTSSISSTSGPLDLTGITQNSVSERCKLTNIVSGVMKCQSNEPINAFIDVKGVITGDTGTSQTYTIEYYISRASGGGFVQLDSDYFVTTPLLGSSTTVEFAIDNIPVMLEPGDLLRLQGVAAAAKSPLVSECHITIRE